MPDRDRKRVSVDGSDVPKGCLTKDPPTHPMNTDDPSIRSWAKKARRVKMKQLVWRSCSRDNVEAGESYFVLNPAADW